MKKEVKKEVKKEKNGQEAGRQLNLMEMNKSEVKRELRKKQEEGFKKERENIKAELAKQVSQNYPSPPVISQKLLQLAYETLVKSETASMFGSDSESDAGAELELDESLERPASKKIKSEAGRNMPTLEDLFPEADLLPSERLLEHGEFTPVVTSTASNKDMKVKLEEAMKDIHNAFNRVER